MKIHASLLAAALLACSAASHAQTPSDAPNANCEAIRAQIDAKVRASGVNDFSLSVVDADASAGGRVVGSCDLGTKKIMYERSGVSSPQSSAPPRPQPKSDRIITECKDGSVNVGGGCKP
jgi:hypothetical protein